MMRLPAGKPKVCAKSIFWLSLNRETAASSAKDNSLAMLSGSPSSSGTLRIKLGQVAQRALFPVGFGGRQALALCAQRIEQRAGVQVGVGLQPGGIANGDGAVGQVVAQAAVGVFERLCLLGAGMPDFRFQGDANAVAVDFDIQALAAALRVFRARVESLRSQ